MLFPFGMFKSSRPFVLLFNILLFTPGWREPTLAVSSKAPVYVVLKVKKLISKSVFIDKQANFQGNRIRFSSRQVIMEYGYPQRG
jgi:hypothetical protein